MQFEGGGEERDFAAEAQELLADLHARELCEGYSIARQQFVIAPPELGRFHITVEFASIPQMQQAFAYIESAEGEAAEDPAAPDCAIRSLQHRALPRLSRTPPKEAACVVISGSF